MKNDERKNELLEINNNKQNSEQNYITHSNSNNILFP